MTLVGENEEYQAAVEDTYQLFLDNKELYSGQILVLDQNYLKKICELAPKYLKADKTVIELESPLYVVGDIHAQYTYLWKFLSDFKEGKKYLFLGDYVDRGSNSTECITLLLCLKMLFPKQCYLIRGNHESFDMTNSYGFYEECKSRFENNADDIYKSFLKVFDYIPLAAIISNPKFPDRRIFCVHGGLASSLTSVEQLKEVQLPVNISEEKCKPEHQFIRDILWSDPSDEIEEGKEYIENTNRKGCQMFSRKAVENFMEKNNFTDIFRAHQYAKEGFEYPFFKKYNDRSVITIFSSPNYGDEMRNPGGMVWVKENFDRDIIIVKSSIFAI